jgi:hypothetical protein
MLTLSPTHTIASPPPTSASYKKHSFCDNMTFRQAIRTKHEQKLAKPLKAAEYPL